jgi:hypothetical protein
MTHLELRHCERSVAIHNFFVKQVLMKLEKSGLPRLRLAMTGFFDAV